MPQENGWATGPEHCDEDGRICPYCGSENTDSGSLDTQAGQVVESGCECLECGKTWGNLYNIAGWYSGEHEDELHEDLRDFNAREHVKGILERLAFHVPPEARDAGALDVAMLVSVANEARAALEATKAEA